MTVMVRHQLGLVRVLMLLLPALGALLMPNTAGCQENDDGKFTVFTSVSADGQGNVSATASDPTPDPELDYAYFEISPAVSWSFSGSNYSASGAGSNFTSGPVPLGASYTASFNFSVTIYSYRYYNEVPTQCGFQDDGDFCEEFDNPSGFAEIYLPAPPPVISSIDPAYGYQGGQGTLTVSGSNFVNHGGDHLVLNFSGGGSPFTLASAPAPCTSGCTASFSYNLSGFAAGTSYQVWLSNDDSDSEPVSFPIYLRSPTTGGPIPYSCSVSANRAAGFTSIVSSGTNSGVSGTFSVSFGGGDFAGITPPQVTYGPSSTPESIAASMAALITRNYAQYGLTAKAVGRNVIYSGTAMSGSGSATLGSVTNVFSGNGGVSSSFAANPSPGAPADVETACESAPPPPTSVCGPDPGPRSQINVPATITLARGLLSQQCKTKFKGFPGYTTPSFFSALNHAIICQYPNNTPPEDAEKSGAYAVTRAAANSIHLLPNFYPPSLDTRGEAFTLIHEGIHLFGRGSLDDDTIKNDLKINDSYGTHNITIYIAQGCAQ